jgi:hypothetical protein
LRRVSPEAEMFARRRGSELAEAEPRWIVDREIAADRRVSGTESLSGLLAIGPRWRVVGSR